MSGEIARIKEQLATYSPRNGGAQPVAAEKEAASAPRAQEGKKPQSAADRAAKVERDILDIKLALMRIDARLEKLGKLESRLEKLSSREDMRKKFDSVDENFAKIREQLAMVEVDAVSKPTRGYVMAMIIIVVGIIGSVAALVLALSQRM